MAGFGSIVGKVLGGVAGGFVGGPTGAAIGSSVGSSIGGAIDGEESPTRQRSKNALIKPLDNGPFRTKYEASKAGSFGLNNNSYEKGDRNSGMRAGDAVTNASPIVREVYFWQSVFESAYQDAKRTTASK